MRTTHISAVLVVVVAALACTPDRQVNCLSSPLKVEAHINRRFGDPAMFDEFHAGIDFGVPVGTEVQAMADGNVTKAGPDDYGSTVVVVKTDRGLLYVFGHLSRVLIHMGDRVQRGQVLGLSGGARGASGSGPFTTGPHLHVSVIDAKGTFIDPAQALCPTNSQSPSR